MTWKFFGQKNKWVLVLLALLALLIYSNTFSVPFQFDDHQNIVENPQIRDLGGFHDFSGTRYIGFLSFALNYHFGGLNPFGYHLVNVLIHIVNGFLVYWLVVLLFQGPERRSWKPEAGREKSSFKLQASSLHLDHRSLTPDPRPLTPSAIALLTALLFIIHPIQTQAVTYIVQRFASLMTLFYLLAVVCYLKWRIGETRGWKLEAGSQKLEAGKSSLQPPASSFCGIWGSWIWYLASLLSTLLAMKTKENSFTLPLMILLVEWVFFRHRHPDLRTYAPTHLRTYLPLLPFFLLAVPIIPLSNYNALGEAEGFARDTADISRLDYLFTQFRVIVTYLRLLVLPINQTLDYDYPVYHSLFALPVLISFLFLLGLLGFAVFLLRRAFNSPQPPLKLRGGEGELFAFGIFWFFLTLSVESSIIPIKDVIFEHRVYLPSVGFFLGVSLMGAWLWQRCQKTKLLHVLFVLSVLLTLCTLSAATYRRNLVWKDPLTLWQDVAAKAPHKARGHYGVGKSWQMEGVLEPAIGAYRNALTLKPDYLDAWLNLGVACKNLGRLDEAIRAYQAALEIKPDSAEAHNNLGSVYSSLGRLDEAILEYETAVKLKYDFVEARYNLGKNYHRKGRISDAVREFERVLKINPDFSPARRALESLPQTIDR